MKLLGIDYGTKNVGIAITDDSGRVAFPFSEISSENCFEKILEIISEKKIDKCIIGQSIDLDGKKNKLMDDISSLCSQLEEHVFVILEPEQFSTQAAKRLGKGSDKEAAAIILQGYIDVNIIDSKIDFD